MQSRVLLLVLIIASGLLPIGQMRYGRPQMEGTAARVGLGEIVFIEACAACHTEEDPLIPDFGLSATLAIDDELREGHHHGATAMSATDVENLAAWLSNLEAQGVIPQSHVGGSE